MSAYSTYFTLRVAELGQRLDGSATNHHGGAKRKIADHVGEVLEPLGEYLGRVPRDGAGVVGAVHVTSLLLYSGQGY